MVLSLEKIWTHARNVRAGLSRLISEEDTETLFDFNDINFGGYELRCEIERKRKPDKTIIRMISASNSVGEVKELSEGVIQHLIDMYEERYKKPTEYAGFAIKNG